MRADDKVFDQGPIYGLDEGKLEEYLMDRHNRDEEPPAELEHEDHTPPSGNADELGLNFMFNGFPMREEPNEALLREPEELYPNEHEDHTPPADQTVLSDSDLLDKLSDLVVRVGRVEIVNVPNDLTARLALRKSLARL
jgi:hypothetical protein